MLIGCYAAGSLSFFEVLFLGASSTGSEALIGSGDSFFTLSFFLATGAFFVVCL